MEKTEMTKINNKYTLITHYKKYLAWLVAAGLTVKQDLNNPKHIHITDKAGNTVMPTLIVAGGPNDSESAEIVHPVAVMKLKCDFSFISNLLERITGRKLQDPEFKKEDKVSPVYPENLLDAAEGYLVSHLPEALKQRSIDAYNTVKLDQLVHGAFDRIVVANNAVTSKDIKCEPEAMINYNEKQMEAAFNAEQAERKQRRI